MRFCTACGSGLKEGGSFCTACGAKQQDPTPLCAVCGTKLKEGSHFCTGCGAKAPPSGGVQSAPAPSAQAVSQQPSPIAQPSSHARKDAAAPDAGMPSDKSLKNVLHSYRPGNNTLAPAAGGEISFSMTLSPVREAAAVLSPVKCISEGLINLIKGFAAAFQDKKKWIPALVMAITWMTLTLLPLLGVNITPLRWLSFLTMAGAGTAGGIVGIAGGAVGKGVFSLFATSLFVPLFSGKNPFKGFSTGFSRLFGSFAVKDTLSLSLLLMGAGASFAAFNFMTGTNASINSMAGITAFFVSLKALSSKSGFLQKFTASLTSGRTRKTSSLTVPAHRLIAGWTAGFALASAVSFLPIAFPYLSYAIGALLLITGLIVLLVSGKEKEVVA